MLDLESLGTKPNAAVLTLGAVKFNPYTDEDPTQALYVKFDVDEQIALGRFVDEGTLRWWSHQSAEVREEALSEGDRLSCNAALDQLNKFLVGADEIWAQGPVFDIPMLESLMRDLKRPIPWHYWQIRDSRTIFKLVGDPRREMDTPDLHNALADAYNQAKAVQIVFKKLNLKPHEYI